MIAGWQLALGVRNLFDTYPDQPKSLTIVDGVNAAKDYNNNFGTFPWAAASPMAFAFSGIFTRVR